VCCRLHIKKGIFRSSMPPASCSRTRSFRFGAGARLPASRLMEQVLVMSFFQPVVRRQADLLSADFVLHAQALECVVPAPSKAELADFRSGCQKAVIFPGLFSIAPDEDITNMDTPIVVAYDSKVKLFFSIIIFNTCDEWTLHLDICSMSFMEVLTWIKEGMDHA
jgi:hypothetical protein